MRARGVLAALLCLCGCNAPPSAPQNDAPALPPKEVPVPAKPAQPETSQFRFGGGLDFDCSHVGDRGYGYQFIQACAGKAIAPNGRWAVATKEGAAAKAKLLDAKGRAAAEIPALDDDGMPFVIFWSSTSNRFFANHYLGSDRDELRVFEIVNGRAIERRSIFASLTRAMVSRYPCLKGHSLAASGWRWSRDGRRVVMVVYARPDACLERDGSGEWRPVGDWEPLWMIADVPRGRIDPASIQVRKNGVGPMPVDGPYADF